MDFRKIEYFLKAADTMNISRAAEELHISHQGLSKQIRLLEEELGIALLERYPGGFRLTETGKKMSEWFRPLVNEVNYRYKKLQEFIEQKKSTIQLGYFNALSYQKCIRPVTQFLNGSGQNITTTILASDIGQVRKLLYSDSIDLAVTVMISPEEWADVSYQVLLEVPLQIIVSEKHPWYRKEKVTVEDLKNGTLLYYADGSEHFPDGRLVVEKIPAPNFDSYIGLLDEGREYGLIADIYSRREGNFKLMDLPEEVRQNAWIIAAYRREHPLRALFEKLQDNVRME